MATRPPTPAEPVPDASPGRPDGVAHADKAGAGTDDVGPAGATQRRRAGRLPSLAELGAFDLPEPAPARPRLSGRLTEEDLRGLPSRGAGAPPVRATASAAPAPAPAEARPFVWPPLKDKARSGAPAPQAVPSRGARGDAALARTAESTRAADPLATGGVNPAVDAVPRAGRAPATSAPEVAPPPSWPDESPGQDTPGRTVPAVNVRWADLHAAVAAGWMTPAAAHALWARWLARKPLMHVEADAADLAALEDEPSVDPEAAGLEGSPDGRVATGEDPPVDPRSVRTPAQASPGAPDETAGGADHERVDPSAGAPGAEGPAFAPAAPQGPDAAEPPPQASGPPPPEVLEPVSLSDADARRAAHWAFHGPRVEVVDVIEVPSLRPREQVSGGSAAAQFALALALAVAAAVCVGIGSTLFGPWGAALAAAGWTAWVWARTAKAHRQGAALEAQIGAHLVLPLVALTVWQGQIAAGFWPAVAPMDLFADVPLGGAVPDTVQRLDWRWLSLAFWPLLAALYWLVRLRRPALLGAVTLLLWAVSFQAVAGVLGALGLSFHGMSTFMLLMGLLTLVAAQSIDLRSRRAGLADFAQWPYLAGAMLLGLGWVSLSVLPGWVLLPRYLAWALFMLWALSVRRVALVGVALALAGFELAWGLGRWAGSDLVALGVWALCLGASTVAVVLLSSRAERWSTLLRVWMPPTWREAYRRRAAPGRPARPRTPR